MLQHYLCTVGQCQHLKAEFLVFLLSGNLSGLRQCLLVDERLVLRIIDVRLQLLSTDSLHSLCHLRLGRIGLSVLLLRKLHDNEVRVVVGDKLLSHLIDEGEAELRHISYLVHEVILPFYARYRLFLKIVVSVLITKL